MHTFLNRIVEKYSYESNLDGRFFLVKRLCLFYLSRKLLVSNLHENQTQFSQKRIILKANVLNDLFTKADICLLATLFSFIFYLFHIKKRFWTTHVVRLFCYADDCFSCFSLVSLHCYVCTFPEASSVDRKLWQLV